MQELGVSEWIARCTQRLQVQWRNVESADLEQAAIDLLRVPRWRAMAPEVAAEEWLRLGVLIDE